jgi:tetratricopeptide (TPR) repeat protein
LLKQLLFHLLLFTSLFSLELTLQSGKEDFEKFSTLHIKDSELFVCQEIKDDFEVVTEVVCAFSQKPISSFKPIQNDFYQITSQVKNKTFFLRIKPYHKIKLVPIVFNLYEDATIFDVKQTLAKHWIVLGYKEKIPFHQIDKVSDVAINFPYTNHKEMLPYVGGLDIKGNPVVIKKIQDVSDYIKIKEAYSDKKYDVCLALIDDVNVEYPNSLFNSEFTFYKIRSYFQLKEYDNVIEEAKKYLSNYSSDENVPEVLALMSKSYGVVGLNVDADYFFDRLFSEHEESEFSKLGFIYKGEMLESSGASSKALEFYNKALNATKDISIASLAAYRLAVYNLAQGNIKEASTYIQKIVNAKSSFFLEDMQDAMKVMYNFQEEGDYITASIMAKALLDGMKPSDDLYEELLKDRALWLAQTDDKKEALTELNRYLTTYQYGTYEEEIKVARDGLFFHDVDLNATAKLAEYDLLIENYSNDTIGNRALYEKAKLLLQEKEYKQVLDLKESLFSLEQEKYPLIQEIIRNAAIGRMENALENKECHVVLEISSDYNISLSSKWDSNIYECAMMGGDFLLAKEMTSRNLKVKNLQERMGWLYKHINVDFSIGNYSEVVEASKDLIALMGDDSTYNQVYRVLFDAYSRLEDDENMLHLINDLERVYGINYKDLDRYTAVMNIGVKKKDNNLIIKYANDVFTIQNASDSYPQTPFVEFTLFQAYFDREEYSKALEVLLSLDKKDLDKTQRSREKYLLGLTHDKLWRNDEAKKYYKEAMDVDPKSPWASLAQSALEI